MPDITVENHGTLFTFELHSEEAKLWVLENVGVESYMWRGPSMFACEHRYAGDLAEGMAAAGFEVAS